MYYINSLFTLIVTFKDYTCFWKNFKLKYVTLLETQQIPFDRHFEIDGCVFYYEFSEFQIHSVNPVKYF